MLTIYALRIIAQVLLAVLLVVRVPERQGAWRDQTRVPVEPRGFEPLTSAVQRRRSPS